MLEFQKLMNVVQFWWDDTDGWTRIWWTQTVASKESASSDMSHTSFWNDKCMIVLRDVLFMIYVFSFMAIIY